MRARAGATSGSSPSSAEHEPPACGPVVNVRRAGLLSVGGSTLVRMEDRERLLFTADLPHALLAMPGGSSDVVAVRDILLAAGDPNVEHVDLAQYPPVLMPTFHDGPFGPAREPEALDLGYGVTLTRMDHDQAERVINACTPRGHYFHPVMQSGQQYTFTRDIPAEDWQEHLYRWDSEDVLTDLLAMSRLILDHGYSTEFGARLIDYRDGSQTVMPLYAAQPVFRLRHTRDWLVAEEVDQLRDLFGAYRSVRRDLPERVQRALWNVDYSFIVRWLNIRLPLLVIGFESLISTSKSLVRRQFIERVPQVAAEAGADDVTPELCKEMYDARSRWAHGSHIALPRSTQTSAEGSEEATPDVDQVAALELGLRRVVRRCIEDREFASVFTDDQSIRDRWHVRL